MCVRTHTTQFTQHIYSAAPISRIPETTRQTRLARSTRRAWCVLISHTRVLAINASILRRCRRRRRCAHMAWSLSPIRRRVVHLSTLSILLYCYYCAVICISRLGRTPCGVQCVYIFFFVNAKGGDVVTNDVLAQCGHTRPQYVYAQQKEESNLHVCWGASIYFINHLLRHRL